MNLSDYEVAAARTINPSLDEKGRLIDAAAGLAEEAGEALSLVVIDRERAADRLRLPDRRPPARSGYGVRRPSGTSDENLSGRRARGVAKRKRRQFVEPPDEGLSEEGNLFHCAP